MTGGHAGRGQQVLRLVWPRQAPPPSPQSAEGGVEEGSSQKFRPRRHSEATAHVSSSTNFRLPTSALRRSPGTLEAPALSRKKACPGLSDACSAARVVSQVADADKDADADTDTGIETDTVDRLRKGGLGLGQGLCLGLGIGIGIGIGLGIGRCSIRHQTVLCMYPHVPYLPLRVSDLRRQTSYTSCTLVWMRQRAASRSGRRWKAEAQLIIDARPYSWHGLEESTQRHTFRTSALRISSRISFPMAGPRPSHVHVQLAWLPDKNKQATFVATVRTYDIPCGLEPGVLTVCSFSFAPRKSSPFPVARRALESNALAFVLAASARRHALGRLATRSTRQAKLQAHTMR